jgi:preprotein translocase subunit SecB
MTDQTSSSQQEADNPQPAFQLQRAYLKDLSLELPHAPQIFLEQEMPQVEISIHVDYQHLEGPVYEVSVTATVTTRIKDKTLYLVEGTQAGIFKLANIPSAQMDPLLHIFCPNMVFPYLRANIADLITRSSLPPLHLGEVNFQAMYEQSLSSTEKQKGQADASDSSIILPPNTTRQ